MKININTKSGIVTYDHPKAVEHLKVMLDQRPLKKAINIMQYINPSINKKLKV